MARNFDYQFGLSGIVPSKQDDREREKIIAFRTLVEEKITPQIMNLAIFPSKKEIVVFMLQFFLTEKEYKSRDVDNISKTVLDCLKGKIYIDDAQVRTLLVSKKIYSRLPANFVSSEFLTLTCTKEQNGWELNVFASGVNWREIKV